MRHKLCPPLSISIFLLSILLLSMVSGCVIKQHTNPIGRTNKSLNSEQVRQKEQIVNLQMSLLEKQAEINRLKIANERLIREFVRSNVHSWSKRNKVETVRLLAEVATIIKTVKNEKLMGHAKDLLLQAQQCLAESRTELDKDNFDGAAYLADQALEKVQAIRLGISTGEQPTNKDTINFLTQLPMKTIEACNVRNGPSKLAKINFVMQAGSNVTAIGYRGQWVKIKDNKQGDGWIHHTLLDGEWE